MSYIVALLKKIFAQRETGAVSQAEGYSTKHYVRYTLSGIVTIAICEQGTQVSVDKPMQP